MARRVSMRAYVRASPPARCLIVTADPRAFILSSLRCQQSSITSSRGTSAHWMDFYYDAKGKGGGGGLGRARGQTRTWTMSPPGWKHRQSQARRSPTARWEAARGMGREAVAMNGLGKSISPCVPTCHGHRGPKPWDVVDETASGALEIWRHCVPQRQHSSADISSPARTVALARTVVISGLVAPENSSQSCCGRVLAHVGPAETRRRPRARPLPTRGVIIHVLNTLGEQCLQGREHPGRSNQLLILSSSLFPLTAQMRSPDGDPVSASQVDRVSCPPIRSRWLPRSFPLSLSRRPTPQAAAATSTLCATPSASPVLTFLPVLAMVASTFS